jgi:hypothetical protein
MGIEIDRDRFTPDDHTRFAARLADCLGVLETMLTRPGFGEGPATIGAEVELALVDGAAHPLPLNREVLEETVDPRMTVELDRFNLECNLRHGALAGAPFAALRREFEDAHAELSRSAAVHAGRVVTVGILPTVRREDLDSEAMMTDTKRYRALARALREGRDAPFRLDIAGQDPLVLDCDGVTFEGAATSLQIHLRVAPSDFGNLFNAAQLATAPALAIASNSPLFLGHRLWEETRIALFKQAVDERDAQAKEEKRLPRVGFGNQWLTDGAFGLFREAVEVFPPLVPVLDTEDPVDCFEAGEIPKLLEIRLHQGTVWNWNRPVYDPADGGHLRIELRALPSGPTTTDMLANMAFLVGLSYGLESEMHELTDRIAFEDAHSSFYRAAQAGPEANLLWPDGAAGVTAPGGRLRAADLVTQLVDVARRGLAAKKVDPADSDPLLDVITQRAASGQTGSIWQKRMLELLETRHSRESALERLVERYIVLSQTDEPVHTWPIEID